MSMKLWLDDERHGKERTVKTLPSLVAEALVCRLRNANSTSGTDNNFDYKPKYQADCA